MSGLLATWEHNPSTEATRQQRRFPFWQNRSGRRAKFPETKASGPRWDMSHHSSSEGDLRCNPKPMSFSWARYTHLVNMNLLIPDYQLKEGRSSGALSEPWLSRLAHLAKIYLKLNSFVSYHMGSQYSLWDFNISPDSGTNRLNYKLSRQPTFPILWDRVQVCNIGWPWIHSNPLV